jgi:hypothetical protein
MDGMDSQFWQVFANNQVVSHKLRSFSALDPRSKDLFHLREVEHTLVQTLVLQAAREVIVRKQEPQLPQPEAATSSVNVCCYFLATSGIYVCIRL